MFRLLLWLALVLPVVVFAAAAWFDYEQVTRAERRRLLVSADSLAEHAQSLLETSELVITLVHDRTAGWPWEEIRSSRPLHEFLLSFTRKLPQLDSIFLVDPTGHEAASSRAFPMPSYDLRGRDYVQAAQSGRDELFISAPFRSLFAGTVSFVVSRPTADQGLIGVTLSPGYFDKFYASVFDRDARSIAALWRDDGTLLVRYPPAPQSEERLPPGSPPWETAQGSGTVVFNATSPIDHVTRMMAARRVQSFPLTATIGVSQSKYLSVWYRHLAMMAGFAALMSALLVLASRKAMLVARGEREGLQRLLAETRRREEVEAALRQSQKMEALGRLTSGVAHDFNNLLTAIIGGIELAMRRSENPQIRRLLGGAMQAAQRGAQLIRQMLALSRRKPMELQPVEVGPLLAGLHDMLRRTLGPAIRIREDIAPGLWRACADPTQLEVAVLNLAINARDAMPQGGELRLCAANLASDAPRPAGVPAGELVVVRVADSGTGMPEEVLRRATEPFFTTKEMGRGTGLGLSMVDALARQAGGMMTIESRLGMGTTVSLFLPRAPEAAGADSPATPAPEGVQRPLNVLVVDDDAAVRSSTAAMLRELGHEVTEAADGTTALRELELALPDLVVLDLAMPGMDGEAVAHRILQRWSHLPVLMMTGYTDRPQDATLPPNIVLLPKPFALEALAAAVQAAIRPLSPQAVAMS